MRLSSILLTLPLAAATIQDIIQARDDENAGDAPSLVVKRFIVEAEPVSSGTYQLSYDALS